MKAVICIKYGPPEVLYQKEVEKPVPKVGEVLVRIEATVAAPSDCAFRKGKPFISRLFSGITRPKYTPGDVLSGTIEEVGKDVKIFKVGDEIYGSSGTNFGTNAQYIALSEDEALAIKPNNISHGEAAGISEGALTALPFLRDTGKIKKGYKVLINGASGGVGVYAVQLAKYFETEVTGVCSTVNLELVNCLGAHKVIDYTKEDFTKTGDTYDIIFDAVGKSSFSHCKKALSPRGLYLSTVPSIFLMLQMLFTSISGSKKAVFAATGLRKPEEKKKDLIILKELIETKKIKPVIDRKFSLEQISDAHRYVEKGHKKGSVIITIEH
ncbi:MAG: NAD(P)-dependent alcohol dehydrogenase [Desulfotomaculaceae bacterium]|nr:NAD(P)-dependent alcohol dehydrogenase [Desulfotomaculaceae bacterium]